MSAEKSEIPTDRAGRAAGRTCPVPGCEEFIFSSNMPQHLLEDHTWEDVSSKTWEEINSE